MSAQNFALEVSVVSHTSQGTLVCPQKVSGGEDYSDVRKLLLSALMMSEISSTTMAAPPYFDRKYITRSMVGA